MFKITTTVVAALLFAGCSSSSGTTKPTDMPHQVLPSMYAPTTGADAAIIAEHITGCRGVQSGDVGKGAPVLSSTATCTLNGYLVIIDSFTSASGPDDVPALVDKTDTYYVHGGTGWLAFLAGPGPNG